MPANFPRTEFLQVTRQVKINGFKPGEQSGRPQKPSGLSYRFPSACNEIPQDLLTEMRWIPVVLQQRIFTIYLAKECILNELVARPMKSAEVLLKVP